MPRRSTRTLAALALGASALVSGVLPAAADVEDPTPWPATATLDPGIDTTPHALRIAGTDRTQTAFSASLLLRGTGNYPFTSPDPTAGNAALDQTSAWWGLGTCPFAVIVTASDVAADALAASSLSDPTDGSDEPLLTRSAAADPFFDPIGASARVDTDSAPIIVTTSGRAGATALAPAARAAIADLAAGGCTDVGAAIVVGGTAAVPAGVDQELIDLGLDQVFRVAGDSRFGTAAAIARALGTGSTVPNSNCTDDDATDGGTAMTFHGNATVEYRTSATTCERLARTVVLTDGITGADALAAGWWTSLWQVPILLVDGNGNLPAATDAALADLVIDHVIALGGTARIPQATLDRAATLASAQTRRVAGPDRYATSVAMAEIFGGWFDTGDGADHDSSLLCLATSSGSGNASVGWPDALTAGPWCAAAGGAAAEVGGTATAAPVRALTPVAGNDPKVTRGLAPSHGAVPVILVPAKGTAVPASVRTFLQGVFDPAEVWCSSLFTGDNCLDPGFVVAFGGPAVLTEAMLLEVSSFVTGSTFVVGADPAPRLGRGHYTDLDLFPVYATGGVALADTSGRYCVARDGAAGVRWLAAFGASEGTTTPKTFLTAQDVQLLGRYRTDRDDVARSPIRLTPTCTRVPTTERLVMRGVAPSGAATGDRLLDLTEDRRFRLSNPIAQSGAESASGADSSSTTGGETSRLVFTDAGLTGLAATSRTEPAALSGAGIDLTWTRGATATDPSTFSATISLTTSLGTVTGVAVGEVLEVNGVWEFRGESSFTGGTWNASGGAGGFTATLDPVQTDPTDDELSWSVDSVLP